MLWHVKNTQLHILGAVHVLSEPFSPSEKVVSVLKAARILAFETNLEIVPNPQLFLYKAGSVLSQHLSAELFSDTKRLWLDTGLPEQELESIQPWWAALRILNAVMQARGFIPKYGVDISALGLAKKDNKTPFFLEPVEAGFSAFINSPLSEQRVFLSRASQHTEEAMSEVESLIKAWRSCSQEGLVQIVERALALTPTIFTALLADRNRLWLRHFVRLAHGSKPAVAVVGVLHMFGPGSILALLEEAGFVCSLEIES